MYCGFPDQGLVLFNVSLQLCLLSEIWVYFTGVWKPNDTPKSKSGRKKDLLLAAASNKQNWASFKLSVHTYSWRGLSRELGQRLTELKFWLIEVTRVRESQYSLGSDQSGVLASGYHPPPEWLPSFLQNSKIYIRLLCILLCISFSPLQTDSKKQEF